MNTHHAAIPSVAEQLADADARTTTPALTTLAAQARVISRTDHLTVLECRLPEGEPVRTEKSDDGRYVVYTDPEQVQPDEALLSYIPAPATGLTRQPEPTSCPAFQGLCTETEPGHHDHARHEDKVRNKTGETLLDVGFVQVSDGAPAVVYIAGMAHEDYLPEEVRPATAKIRRLLDKADAIADQLRGIEQQPGQREFSTALDAIEAALESSTDPNGTALALRTAVDMTAAEAGVR